MQEASHHGQVIREYRELKAGITQEELAQRIGKSRRTIVTIEQNARIGDVKLRRALQWALQVPPSLLGLSDDIAAKTVVFHPIEVPSSSEEKKLSRIVFDTFTDNLRMRVDLY